MIKTVIHGKSILPSFIRTGVVSAVFVFLAVATLCVNSGPGSFALSAQAPGPGPYDVLVWKLQ